MAGKRETAEHGKSKHAVIVLILLFIVAASTAWLTMALLTARSDDTINTFTLGRGVEIQLEEPKFKEHTQDTFQSDFSPGSVIDKDPTISIKGGQPQEYIAAKVFYFIDKDGDGNIDENNERVSYSEFQQYASIGTEKDNQCVFLETKNESGTITYINEANSLGTNWFTIDDCETFFYGKKELGQNGKMNIMLTPFSQYSDKEEKKVNETVIFNKVQIRPDIPVYSVSCKDPSRKGKPVSFQIWVTAYAVEAGKNISSETALGEFKTMGLSIPES